MKNLYKTDSYAILRGDLTYRMCDAANRARQARIDFWHSLAPYAKITRKRKGGESRTIARRKIWIDRNYTGDYFMKSYKHTAPGYYVAGRYFGTRYFQARARAHFLSREFGRTIEVECIGLSAPCVSLPFDYTNVSTVTEEFI